ncbi:MAG: hypothetical protein JST21_05145 [Bacteroidetes bacterium]|nr:hypothetical protein [Bacteroidota bacterium]
MQVTHIHGHLLQEEGYYPFGLEMKAISSQAAMKMQTQYKFNAGTMLETSFDVDYYETYFRQYDAQIGRFTGVDVLSEQTIALSGYQFAGDNPISFNDPTGAMRQFNVNGMAPRREAPTVWNPNFGRHESGWYENDFFDLITGGTTGGSMFSWNDFFTVLNSKHGGGWSEVTGVYFFKADPYNFTSSVTSAEQLQFGKYFAAISSTDAGQLLISKIAETGQVFTVTNGKLPDNSNALMEYSAKNNLMYVGSTMQGSSIEPGVFDALAHELFHAYQDYRGYHIPGRDDDEPDAYIFASLVDRQYSQTNLDNHDWMTQDIWNKLVVNPPSTRAEEDFLRAWDKFFDHGFSKEDYFQIFNNFLSGSTEGKRYRGPFNITNTHNLIYEFLNP